MDKKPMLEYAEFRPVKKPRKSITLLLWIIFLAVIYGLYSVIDFIPRHK